MRSSLPEHDDRSSALRYFEALETIAWRGGMKDDPRVLKALAVIAANPGDLKTIKTIYEQVKNLVTSSPRFVAQQADANPFQPYPSSSVDGPICLGSVYHPFALKEARFGLSGSELNQNLLVAGRAGAGKTVVLLRIAENLLNVGIPFLVFDFKQDYRHLIRCHSQIRVFSWKTFKWNPLEPPPGVDSAYWTNIVADVFFTCFFSSPPAAAKSVFLGELNRQFKDILSAQGSRSVPTLHDLLDSINAMARRKGCGQPGDLERLRTSQSRVDPLLQILGHMLDCESGYSIEELLREPVVLELDGLTVEIQSFIVTLLFYWIFTYRLSRSERGSLRHVLIFDEAKMVFSKDQATGSSPISRLASTAREMGQALVLADQMPSTLGHAILANVYTMICLSLSATKDMSDMGYAMGLSAEQKTTLNRLPLGTGVVKMAGRRPDPFLARFPDFPLRKDVSDAELARHMKPVLDGLAYRPINRPHQGGGSSTPSPNTPSSAAGPRPTSQPTAQPAIAVSPAPSIDLSEDERAVLMDIRNHPFHSVVERTRSLGLTNYKANRIYGSLRGKGLIRDIDIPTGRRGRAPKYFELTREAEARVGRQNLGPGKGGFEHVFHQRRLKERFERQGFDVQIEHFENGKAVDVGIHRDGDAIAIEIAMTPGGEVSNFEKDFAAGWKKIWSVCRDAKVRDQIEAEWARKKDQYPPDLVEFFLILDPILNSEAGGAIATSASARTKSSKY